MTQEQLMIAYQELARAVREHAQRVVSSKDGVDPEGVFPLISMLERHKDQGLNQLKPWVGAVIQLAPWQPDSKDDVGCDWGPLFAIVEEVRGWGVICYGFIPTERRQPPGQMYMRVKNGEYAIIGHAEWVVQTPPGGFDPPDQQND
jgi:hypothetical protein